MGFGFLIERFDVFLVYATRGAALNSDLQLCAPEWLGLGMILLATRSFHRNCRLIQAETEAPCHGARVERVLTALLVAPTLFLALYVG